VTAADDATSGGTTTAAGAAAVVLTATRVLLLFLARLVLLLLLLLVLLLRLLGVLRVPGRIAAAGVIAMVKANSRRQPCATAALVFKPRIMRSSHR